MVEKIYYSMGEVTEMFDVEPSVIRYWCKQFSCLKPKRNAKGNRLFSKQDVERLKRIYHLLKEKKMTIEGAQKAMRKSKVDEVGKDPDMSLLEQLQSVKAMIEEMRNSLGEEQANAEAEEIVVESGGEPIVAPVADVAPELVEEVVAEAESIAEEVVVEVAEEPEVVAESEEVAESEAPSEEVAQPSEPLQPKPKQKKKRTPRRKLIGEENVVERPLFPFYEQTLF